MLVEQVMTKNPYSVSSSSSVADAARLMNRNNVRHLLVVDHGRLQGIISVNDIPRHVKPQLTVFDIMTANPISVQATDSVDDARRLMSSYRVASLPVISGDHVVGIITASDVA